MTTNITATVVRRQFAEIAKKVEGGEAHVVTRHEKPIFAIISAKDYELFEKLKAMQDDLEKFFKNGMKEPAKNQTITLPPSDYKVNASACLNHDRTPFPCAQCGVDINKMKGIPETVGGKTYCGMDCMKKACPKVKCLSCGEMIEDTGGNPPMHPDCPKTTKGFDATVPPLRYDGNNKIMPGPELDQLMEEVKGEVKRMVEEGTAPKTDLVAVERLVGALEQGDFNAPPTELKQGSETIIPDNAKKALFTGD